MSRDRGICGECGWHRRHPQQCGCPCYNASMAQFIELSPERYHADAMCNCSHFVPTLLYLASPPAKPENTCERCEHVVIHWHGSYFELECRCRHMQVQNRKLGLVVRPAWPCMCGCFEPRRGRVREVEMIDE